MKGIKKKEMDDFMNIFSGDIPNVLMYYSGNLITSVTDYERGVKIKDSEELLLKKKREIVKRIGDMYVGLKAIQLYYDIDDSKIKGRIDDILWVSEVVN